jgi:uncharacterized membrane protein YfcA
MLGSAAWAYRKGTDWPSLRPALIGAAVMMPVGLYLFNNLSLDLLVRGTGLAILVMVLLSMRNRDIQRSSETAGGSSLLTGAIGGFLGGAVNIAGPPVAAYALKQGWSPDRFKAFVTQLLLVVSIYKVIGLAVGGDITKDAALLALWTTPFSIVGIQLGVIASKYVAPQKFQRIVAIVLIAVACMLMLRGSPKESAGQQGEATAAVAIDRARDFGNSGMSSPRDQRPQAISCRCVAGDPPLSLAVSHSHRADRRVSNLLAERPFPRPRESAHRRQSAI